MTEEEKFNIINGIKQFGILLSDENQGLIKTTMEQNFHEKYKDFDLIENWNCFLDEVTRLETVIELHDQLAICNEKDLTFLISQDPDDLDLEYRDEEWLKRLEERIRNQLLEKWVLE